MILRTSPMASGPMPSPGRRTRLFAVSFVVLAGFAGSRPPARDLRAWQTLVRACQRTRLEKALGTAGADAGSHFDLDFHFRRCEAADDHGRRGRGLGECV